MRKNISKGGPQLSKEAQRLAGVINILSIEDKQNLIRLITLFSTAPKRVQDEYDAKIRALIAQDSKLPAELTEGLKVIIEGLELRLSLFDMEIV